MAFDFFETGVVSNMIQGPNEAIREMQQANIDARWDATTAKYTIKEQHDFGSNIYHDIEVWIDYVVGMSSRGTTNGDDFRQLVFQDINHPVQRGLYYKFDDAVWLTYFTDEYNSLVKDIGVRRCNNALRIIDPENGGIFSVPCVIDYDMTSPSPQINSNIITLNNHATVMVQGNKDTIRLLKINTRYILGGRPFKLLSYRNALIDKELAQYPTLLYLDLYLDELQAKDSIENQLAYNGDYNYAIVMDNYSMKLKKGSTGSFVASVTLNGKEVNRPIKWYSKTPMFVDVDDNGNYIVVGRTNAVCEIVAYVEGNKDAYATMKVTISTDDEIKPKIAIEPTFDKIRQFETIEFVVTIVHGDNIYTPTFSEVEVEGNSVAISKNGNTYKLTGLKIDKVPQLLKIKALNDSPNFKVEETYSIQAVSMMG